MYYELLLDYLKAKLIIREINNQNLEHVFSTFPTHFKLLKPTGHVMHHQFNIQQLYALPTLYLCFFVFI